MVDLIHRRADELDFRIAERVDLRDELHHLSRRALRLDLRRCDPKLICQIIDPEP